MRRYAMKLIDALLWLCSAMTRGLESVWLSLRPRSKKSTDYEMIALLKDASEWMERDMKRSMNEKHWP